MSEDPGLDRSVQSYGKRLYIHDYSFQSVTPATKETRDRVARGLMSGKAMRIAEHHLEGAVELGLIAHSVADLALDGLRRSLYRDLSELLRTLARCANSEDVPLLTFADSVVATCFDSGYWTFATTKAAAERMFADNEPLGKLYQEVATRTEPSDLTMIRGARLTLTTVNHQLDKSVQLVRSTEFADAGRWQAECREALSGIAQSVFEMLSRLMDQSDPINARLADDINGVLARLSKESETAAAR